MPDKTQQLLDQINAETGYGVLLLSQMDGIPDTLQFIVATTEYDEQADGLRDRTRYVVRALGVQEHRISLGMFKSISITRDHPLIYEDNTDPVGVFFRGMPDNANELVLDIFQAYASTFGPWRQIPRYLNMNRPLVELVSSGGELLGEMPKPLAERMEKVLQHHKLETKLMQGKHPDGTPTVKALLMDDSYVVALDFSVDELGKA